MLKGKDIIIVGQQPWDTEIGSNCKDIALEFSKYNRVLYVNSALDRISLQRGKNNPKVQKRLNVIKGEENGLVQISDNLYNLYPDYLIESINWVRPTFLFDKLNFRNNKKFAKSISKALDKLGFKNFLLFNDNEMFKAFYLKDFLKPVLSAYYSRDNMVGVDYWKRHGLTLEPKLIAKSDLCLANSEYLRDYCKQYNNNSFYVGQGCDFSLFKQEGLPIPDDIKEIPKPIIGYVGALLTSRLDLPLLESIAQQCPQWSWVFVGPEDDEFKRSSLHQLKNVYFPGSKKPELLAAYINAFDVCINPQFVNPITIGNYPRKIDEYLALGKPTIATKTPSMIAFEDHVYLAENQSGYIEGITKLLQENDQSLPQKRISFALSHTWENSVGKIYDAFVQTAARENILL